MDRPPLSSKETRYQRVLCRIVPIVTDAEHSGKHGQVMNGLRDPTVISSWRILSRVLTLPSVGTGQMAYYSVMDMHIE
jgi:hypothetical protein